MSNLHPNFARPMVGEIVYCDISLTNTASLCVVIDVNDTSNPVIIRIQQYGVPDSEALMLEDIAENFVLSNVDQQGNGEWVYAQPADPQISELVECIMPSAGQRMVWQIIQFNDETDHAIAKPFNRPDIENWRMGFEIGGLDPIISPRIYYYSFLPRG